MLIISAQDGPRIDSSLALFAEVDLPESSSGKSRLPPFLKTDSNNASKNLSSSERVTVALWAEATTGRIPDKRRAKRNIFGNISKFSDSAFNDVVKPQEPDCFSRMIDDWKN